MSLRCIVEHAVCGQNDIDPSRPPGSSCCTLFCSQASASSQASPTGGPARDVVPLAVIADTANHDEIHPKFVKGCAPCRWRHNGKRWQQEFSFQHPRTGATVSPITERPASMPGPWAIGCVLCANFVAQRGRNSLGRCSAFSKFEVRSLNTSQGPEIKRHCGSEFHAEAMEVRAAPDTVKFVGRG